MVEQRFSSLSITDAPTNVKNTNYASYDMIRIQFMNAFALEKTVNKKETIKRTRLLKVIEKKRSILKELVIKVETLRISLDMAKQEYMVKVGSLFLKDNHLDLEIIRLQNILSLMHDGLTYDQASKQIQETYYSQQIEFEREQAQIREDEKIMQMREENETKPHDDIKDIWKRLIAKFHPDLIQDTKEKKKRDAVMKQINRAYQEGDYDQLVKIERDNVLHEETTIDNLEEILLTLMTDIEKLRIEMRELKQSEWHDWMEKIERAKKKNSNIFADTERKLLDDIVAKYDVLNALKAEIRIKDKSANLL